MHFKKNKQVEAKLDKTDLAILELLQTNSKITNLELSKRIGLSPAPTLERVKKLESSGVIKSYHAKIDRRKLGLNVNTFVLVSLDWKKANTHEIFIQKVSDIEEISECYIITGEADFILKITCKDLQAYEELLFKKLCQIEEVERLKTLMTLSEVKKSEVLAFKYN